MTVYTCDLLSPLTIPQFEVENYVAMVTATKECCVDFCILLMLYSFYSWRPVTGLQNQSTVTLVLSISSTFLS